jgi:ABC-type uncharacterized transport system substrate-binding protein
MMNPSNPETPRRSAEAIEAARKLGLTMEVVHAALPLDIDKAFRTLMERRVEALLLGADVSYSNHVPQFISIAARHKLPLMYYRREFVEAGGLAVAAGSSTASWR